MYIRGLRDANVSYNDYNDTTTSQEYLLSLDGNTGIKIA